MLSPGTDMTVLYRNYRGEVDRRNIAIITPPYWGATEWHATPQWLILVRDVDKQVQRVFAVKDMQPAD